MSNLIDLTSLTDRDVEALLDVAAGTEGASLEGLSPSGEKAVTQAFAKKGVAVPDWYFHPARFLGFKVR